MNKRNRTLCAVIFLYIALPGCTSTYLALEAGNASAMSPDRVETIGIGKYSYRFTLINPYGGEPMRNHPFSLTTFKTSRHQPKWSKDGGMVYQGITDKNGQTPTFQLNDKIRDKDFDLRERFGSGSHGITFRLRSNTSGKILREESYFIVVCSEPMEYYSGYTDKNGDTGHVLSNGSVEAILVAGIRDEEFNYRADCDKLIAKP